MRTLAMLLIYNLSLLFFSGCSDNSTSDSANPNIMSVVPVNASPGDIITVYGNNLGYKPVDGEVNLGGISIPSSKTIKWNNSFIRFNLPLNAVSGNIKVKYDNKTSNEFDYIVADKPSIDMIAIQPGEFIMGSENGFGDERPAHKVRLTRAFEIGKFEITQKIWRLVMNYNNSRIESERLPVINIDWLEAIEFCNRLSNTMGLDSAYTKSGENIFFNQDADGYRLPTEAEWEYACRAGSSGDFPGTSNIDDIAWYNGNSAYNPHPIGIKNANSWNIFDMNGNVWEWCWDWYDGDYYKVANIADPLGPSAGTRHVLRGGSCADGATYARSANRSYQSVNFNNCGLRIARNK